MFIKNIHNNIRGIIIMIVSMVIMVSPLVGNAAMLRAGSSKSVVTVGDTAVISFYIDTQSQIINNGEAVITYPKDIISVNSISTQGSVFGMWVEQPSFSNATGKITFNGGVPNPGYQGARGLLFTATVTAKKVGVATLAFSGASIRANDGLGTDVYSESSGVALTIVAASPEPDEAEVPVKEVVVTEQKNGIVPIISSPSHPDQSLWYQTADAVLAWTSAQKLVAIKTVFDAIPRTIPQGKNEAPSNTRVIKNIKDGVAYFHLRYVTSSGISDTAHFTVRVDTTAPDQVIAEVVRNEKNERVIVMSAQDALSGVDSFDVVFNNELQARILASNGKATYAIPRGLEIGTYDIVITAYDKARNKKTVSLPLVLDEYEPPVLTVTQKTVYQGMNMVVKGEYAVPGKELLVYIKNPNGLLEQYLVTPDENGMFTIKVKTWNHSGMYEMWSESLTSQKNSFATSKRLTYYVRKNIGIDIIKVSVVILPFIIIGNGLTYFFLARRIPKKVTKKKRLEVTD